MAEPRYNPTNPGDAAAKLGPEKARQGQNIKGMVWVLIVGIALVVLAYTVMLALGAQQSGSDTVVPPAPAQVETTQSPA